jgi:transposase InsO family protein
MHTGYSRIQVKRFAQTKRARGKLIIRPRAQNGFQTFYTSTDVSLLVELDNAHSRLSGKATKALITRAYTVYDDLRFERLSHISVSHLYNLRGRKQYTSHALTCTKTNPVPTPIGLRKKPEHGGKPGYLRVDSVHQGDLDKEKGVYHINIVDEVTQWEIILCVEGISEYFLTPALEEALLLFPFHIVNFHSDNGSEYINGRVAELLEKLRVTQTKSRSRHTNDNALVECKNGAVVRKHMGYVHIPKKYAKAINDFYRNHMDMYLNFHRPCGFATLRIDRRGKETKKYDIYRTPFEQLQTIEHVEAYLRSGVSIAQLEQTAHKESDLESAKNMQKAKQKLFETFKKC